MRTSAAVRNEGGSAATGGMGLHRSGVGLPVGYALAWLGRLSLIALFVLVLQPEAGPGPGVAVVAAYLLLNVAVAARFAYQNIAYLLFQFAFAFFLLNAMLIGGLTRGETGLEVYAADVWAHVLTLLMVSLVGVDAGYTFFGPRNRQGAGWIAGSQSDARRQFLRRFAGIGFWVFAPIEVFWQLDKIRYVQSEGYLAYYSSYTPPLPFVFGASEIAFTFFFVVFLASRPRKRQAMPLVVVYLATQAMALAFGQRNPFLAGVLLVVFYFGLREWESAKRGEWVSRRLLVLAVLVAPLLLSFLYIVSFERLDRDPDAISTLEAAVGVLEQQGGSVHILAQARIHEEELERYGPYVFTPVKRIIAGNPLGAVLFDVPDLSPQTVEFATQSGSFPEALSYIVVPTTYFSGGGIGAAYPAELHQDFGLAGVFVGSLLFGLIFAWARVVASLGTRALLFLLLALPAIWYAPRASFLAFVYDCLNPVVLGLLGVTWLAWKVEQKRGQARRDGETTPSRVSTART